MEPITYRHPYCIRRYDIYHLEGQDEGAFHDEVDARMYLAALRQRAKEPDSFFRAVKANFVLYREVIDHAENCGPRESKSSD